MVSCAELPGHDLICVVSSAWAETDAHSGAVTGNSACGTVRLSWTDQVIRQNPIGDIGSDECVGGVCFVL